MNVRLYGLAVIFVSCLGGVTVGETHAAVATDVAGLVKVKAKHVDSAWLLPGADFRPYTKVMIDDAEVAFRKGWMRDVNHLRGSMSRVTDEDAKEIADAARSGFGEIFEDAYRKAGYQIATEAGPDVLRLSPAIVDLYINAPEPNKGATRVYSVEAGEARMILSASDSMTGALLGVAMDRRTAGDHGGLGFGRFTWTTRTSNKNDFAQMFRAWAQTCAKGLDELKAQSPVPIGTSN